MRLLKWLVYAAIGYFVYEMVTGMQEATEQVERPAQRGRGQGRGQRRAGQNISGRGKGKRVPVTGAGGTLEHETVGRGVVR